MNYIVMDLEWNQSSNPAEIEAAAIPFEIIEIGAIKLNDCFENIGEFERLVKPTVYSRINPITGKLVGLNMKMLADEEPFQIVGQEFLDFCGEEYMFGVWGTTDLVELQRNMRLHNLTPLSDKPLPFLDIQKLFSLAFEDGKSRRSLEYAVEFLKIEKDAPFHRAYWDAYYTGIVLQRIVAEHREVLSNISYDVFHPPLTRKQEIRIAFGDYVKYISRVFPTRAEAFEDREVSSSKCYLCRRNLRKKVRWFSSNSKHYYCLAYCEKHGYLKGKIRVKKTDEGQVFVVKTNKLISQAEAEALRARSIRVRESKKKTQKEQQ